MTPPMREATETPAALYAEWRQAVHAVRDAGSDAEVDEPSERAHALLLRLFRAPSRTSADVAAKMAAVRMETAGVSQEHAAFGAFLDGVEADLFRLMR